MRQGSFVRKGAAPAADPGTRPGLHGQTLVSLGQADLDRLLGGGLPLGTLLLLLDDGWSGHAATLLRYFLAEGAACGQSLLLAAAPPPAGGLPAFVPPQLKRGSALDKDEEGGEEVKLRIAWQYRRYLQGGAGGTPGGLSDLAGSSAARVGDSRSGGSSSARRSGGSSGGSSGSWAARKPAGLRDWCHHFDLLKGGGAEGLAGCRAELVDCSAGSCDGGDGDRPASMRRLVQAVAAFVQSLSPSEQQPGSAAAPPAAAEAASLTARGPVAPPRGPQHVGRLAILSLGCLGWQAAPQAGTSTLNSSASVSASRSRSSATAGRAVLRTLLQLKATLRDRRCTAIVSLPASLFSLSDLARMQHLADGVIALESVADGSDIARLAPDPASVAGLLHLRKMPVLGTAARPAPEVALHLVRHRRRRLAITPVEVDPDAEVADEASGAGRSVASALCGGPPKHSGSALEF